MNARIGRLARTSRTGSQVLFLVLFGVLLLLAGRPGMSPTLTGLFFYFDPLILLTSLASVGSVIGIQLLALIPVVLTLALGRFFCGWACPLGTLNHFVSWLSIRLAKRKKNKKGDRKFFWVKYVVLLLVLVTAALGSRFGTVLDPISILTRSAAVVVVPEVRGLVRTQAEFVGLLFLLVLLLNFHRRRFYCNVVCPLGALYGLVARLSPLRFRTGESCNGCLSCARYCASRNGPSETHSKQDCTLCFDCVADCPHECIELSGTAPGRGSNVPIDIGRRKTIGALASGVFVAGFPGISPARAAKRHSFLRPPGSLPETDFLERCIRCGACVQACPTSFLQSAGLQTGIDGLWTPIANAQTGFCEYECNSCNTACPTRAIEPLGLFDKQLFKIGSAVVDRSRCLTFADGVNCTVCADRCPVPEKAIRFREVELGTYRGTAATVNQIYVVPELCNGCGICEYECPRTDSGIVLTADDEQREFGF